MQILEGHKGAIQALAFSPDGTTLASAGQDGILLKWDTSGASSELIHADGPLGSLAFGESGRCFAAGGTDGSLAVWNFEQGLVKMFRPVGSSSITGLAFLPGESQLAVASVDEHGKSGGKPGLMLFDWQSGRSRSLPIDQGVSTSVRALAGQAKQRLLAWTTEPRALTVWNQTKPDPINFKPTSPCNALAISPDGLALVAACDWKAIVYGIVRKQERFALTGHKGNVRSLAISPDNRRILTGSWDKTVKCWEADSGREVSSYDWRIGRVNCVAFAPDGLRAAAAGDEGKIIVWDVEE